MSAGASGEVDGRNTRNESERKQPDHDSVGINRQSLNTSPLQHRRQTATAPGQGGAL
jgi:hypothetical protein